jgi:hypothetical protein
MVKKNDWLTAAAIGLMAMCVVTFDHEALGHGGMCLAFGGHIRLLTSSLFRCDVRTAWLDVAGPLGNLLMATLALACLRFVPLRLLGLRLFLITVTAFGYFWESGYLIRAMHRKEGDLYFAVRDFWGDPGVWQRTMAAIAGLIFFVFTARLASKLLLDIWPNAVQARAMARTVWISATLGAALAALAYQGHGWGNLRDSILEIGLASFLFLFIPVRSRRAENASSPAVLERSYFTIALAVLIYAVFVATMGRGIVN